MFSHTKLKIHCHFLVFLFCCFYCFYYVLGFYFFRIFHRLFLNKNQVFTTVKDLEYFHLFLYSRRSSWNGGDILWSQYTWLPKISSIWLFWFLVLLTLAYFVPRYQLIDQVGVNMIVFGQSFHINLKCWKLEKTWTRFVIFHQHSSDNNQHVCEQFRSSKWRNFLLVWFCFGTKVFLVYSPATVTTVHTVPISHSNPCDWWFVCV